jgi:hypothetical protein
LSSSNDNATIPLTGQAKSVLAGANHTEFSMSGGDTLNVPAGTYYFTKFTISGGSSVTLNGAVHILVTGTVSISGGSSVSANAYALRFWHSGTTFSLSSSTFTGIVYAPSASLTVSSSRLIGSVFANAVTISGGTSHVTRSIDDVAPNIAITSPANGAGVSDAAHVVVRGTVADGQTDVTVTVNGQAATVAADGTWQVTLNLSGSASPTTVTATATDAVGNSAASTISVVTAPPAISLTSPLPGALVGTRIVSLSGASGTAASVTVNGTSAALSGGNWLLTGFDLGADGSHTLTIIGTNGAGGTTIAPVITSDTTPPAVTAAVAPLPNAAGWNKSVTTVTFTCTDATSGIASCPSQVVVSVETASQTVSGTAADNAGNHAPASATVKLDKSAPIVSVTAPASGTTVTSSALSISGTVSDALSGIAGVTCNQGIAATLTNGTFTCNVVLVAGDNTITVTATDVAGNTAATTTHATYNADSQSPNIAITSPANGTFTKDSIVNVSGTANDDVAVASVTVNGTPVTLTNGLWTTTVTLSSGDGSKSITAVATDTSNKQSTASINVVVDATAPTIVSAITPAPNGAGWNSAPATVSFICADAGGSGVAACFDAVTMTGEGAGQSITGTATDRAGNTGSVTVTLKIDKTAPVATATAAPAPNAAGWNKTDVTVTFAGTDALSGIATADAPKSVTAEGAGQAVSGGVVDFAGNTATATASVNLDKTAPVLAIAPALPATVYNATSVAVSGTVTDALAGIAGVTCGTATATLQGNAFQCIAPLVNGSNLIAVTATDKAGNVTVLSPAVMAVHDTAPPGIVARTTRIANAAGWFHEVLAVEFECTDAISGIATCPDRVIIDTDTTGRTISGTATDRAGNTASTSIAVKLDATAPTLMIQGVGDTLGDILTNSAMLPVAGTVNDTLSGVSSVRCNGASATLTPPAFNCSVPLGETRVIVTVEVTDVSGNVTAQTFMVSRDMAKPEIGIITPVEESVTPEATAALDAAIDDDVAIATVRLDGAAITPTNNHLHKTLALQEGNNSFVIEAADTAGNVATKTLHVTRRSPVTVDIRSPADLETAQTSTVPVSGIVSSGIVTVFVNGIPATVSGTTFTAPNVPLVQGRSVITAVAAGPDGRQATSTIHIYRDAIPPRLTVRYPVDGATVNQSPVTIVGSVDDIVVGTINARQVSVKANGVDGQVINRSFAIHGVVLSEGANTLVISATDQGGNVTTVSQHVTLQSQPGANRLAIISGDGQTATIGAELPQPLVIRALDAAGAPLANRALTFRVLENNGSLAAPGKSGREVTLSTDALGQANVRWTLGTRAGAGNNRVQVRGAGFDTPVQFQASALTGAPAMIVIDSGDRQFGATEQHLARPLLAVVVDLGSNRVGDVPVEFSVAGGDGNIDGQPSKIVSTDSDGRAWVTPTLGTTAGNDNQLFIAQVAGIPPVQFVASARVAGNAAMTRILGAVADNSNLPLPGVTVRIEGSMQTAVTDAQGQFVIPGAPAGYVKLIIDGSTAGRPGTWPMLEYAMYSIPGVDNTLEMPVYLLPIDTTRSITVSEAQGGTLTLPELPGFSLSVAPGAVTFPGGGRIGAISATLVHNDKMPMPPGFGQQPRFIVTIQPAGAHFDPPAKITFPNVDGLAPGEITELYSFDHDLGQFVAIGTGSISDDGSTLVSDPGAGIIKAGWHCGGNPAASGTASCLNVSVPPANSGGGSSAGDITVTANGATAPVGVTVRAVAGGTPANGGTYSNWEIFDDPDDPNDDPGAGIFLTTPSCANQATCTATMRGIREGVITFRVTFTNASASSSSTTRGRLQSTATSGTATSQKRKVRFTNAVLEAVMFMNNINILTDLGVNYPVYQWVRGNPDPRQTPVWYQRYFVEPGHPTPPKRMKVKVKIEGFSNSHPQISNVTIEGVATAGFRFKLENTFVPANEHFVEKEIEADADLPGATKFYDPLTIDWTLKIGNDSAFPIGQSKNEVYVSLRPFPGTTNYPITALHYAVKNDGQTTLEGVREASFTSFASKDIVSYDGRALHYYDPASPTVVEPSTPFGTAQGLLTVGNGQCRTWADLLRLVFRINGIQAVPMEVTAPGYSLVINNWDFTGQPNQLGLYETGRDRCNHATLPPGTYGQAINLTGLQGQNSETPGLKVFRNHVFVGIIVNGVMLPDRFYDPSYGTKYTGLADFEQQAVAGLGLYSPLDNKVQILRRTGPLGVTYEFIQDVGSDPSTCPP